MVAVWVSQEIRLESRKGQMEKVEGAWTKCGQRTGDSDQEDFVTMGLKDL